MALDTIRDVTSQLFPYRSPPLMKTANKIFRMIVDYKNDIFLGFFSDDGQVLEDMLPILSVYRLVEGGIAILFVNQHDAPFVHILEKKQDGYIHLPNIRGSEPVPINEQFVSSENEQYNKLAHLFTSPDKVEGESSVA